MSEVAWKTVGEIQKMMDEKPDSVTPWFLERKGALGSVVEEEKGE